ncbi:hypothetical protein PM8797T_16423 [Gimesia maris DSM 8797]|nr:hypothetical protein PM8797T_16423 [Gimesia maris DSM 8797]
MLVMSNGRSLQGAEIENENVLRQLDQGF